MTAAPITAYLAVGANIEPEANILRAGKLLARQERITGVSTFYWTQPIGPAGEPTGGADFLNGLWRIETVRQPAELKQQVLRPIEQALGRRRSADRFAPRTIDLDLVLYGRLVLADEDLVLPSPDIARPFVAAPLLELAGDVILPGRKEPLSSVLARLGLATLRPADDFTRRLRKVLCP